MARIRAVVGKGFFYLFFSAFLIIWIYPLLWTASASLKSNIETLSGSPSLLPSGFKWAMLLPWHWGQLSVFDFKNYADAWYVASFQQYFTNTLLFTILTVLIVIALCSLTGYVLGRYSFPGKKLFIGSIIVTLFIPQGYTIIPVWKLVNAIGLQESLLGMVLAEVGGAHVLLILMFMAYFAAIPKELEEASVMDGASFFLIFWRVMFPLSMPVVATTVVIQSLWTWNDFFIPLVFSINQPSLQTLGVGMLNFMSMYGSNVSGMTAGAMISFIPIVLVFLFFQRYFVEGIAGAVKQ
ncbi:MAG TPA: carbohydrate ABC transporter permease [Spirochaetia bacterium]|nr:carbohydrate ABC transporter permease [Spirochaetia bacterium]